ncbi:MAG: hypothetical protein Q4B68_09635 [Bacteroidales bacterium]|nr:hypothetical protein [Bacteroidales bacterium]
MNRISKAFIFVAAVAALAGCKQADKSAESASAVQGAFSQVDAQTAAPAALSGKLVDAHTYELNGATYTCHDDFSPEAYSRDAKGEVTFTAFPATYEEFAHLYDNFLGKSAAGTAAMATMAMEMYYRDAEAGERCVDLLCNSGCAAGMKNIVAEKVRSWKKGDPYGQRYLPAAVLKGANAENGYQPTMPYTIEMKASVNKHEKIQISDNGVCLFIYVMGDGWDSHQRQVQVFMPTGGDHYKMWNASSLYVQCKNALKDFIDLK